MRAGASPARKADLRLAGLLFAKLCGGGAATIGATYFFDPTWFLDFNYTFAMTGDQALGYSSPFTNPNGTNGSTVTGTLVDTSSGRVITQGVTATVNKAF